MRKYEGIPELLEQFMRDQDSDGRWVTVRELRDHFDLTRYQCNTLSGFLRRLHAGNFGRFPYIVMGITRDEGSSPSDPKKCRYLVKRRHSYGAAQKDALRKETACGP